MKEFDTIWIPIIKACLWAYNSRQSDGFRNWHNNDQVSNALGALLLHRKTTGWQEGNKQIASL